MKNALILATVVATALVGSVAARESTARAPHPGYRALSTAELQALAPYLEIVDGRKANLTQAHLKSNGIAAVWMSGGGGIRQMFGRWRTMEGGRLCLKLPAITGGRELCPRIVVKGNSFKALGKDGKNIRYLIVEFPEDGGPRDVQEALSRAR